MARRRLTPIPSLDVPHAEHSVAPIPPRSFDPPPPSPMSQPMPPPLPPPRRLPAPSPTARETGRLVLDLSLAEIAADHLTRDRLPDEPTTRWRR